MFKQALHRAGGLVALSVASLTFVPASAQTLPAYQGPVTVVVKVALAAKTTPAAAHDDEAVTRLCFAKTLAKSQHRGPAALCAFVSLGLDELLGRPVSHARIQSNQRTRQ